MRSRTFTTIAICAAMIFGTTNVALADAAKPGQSMTHMKTAPGLSAAFESLGLFLYVQGGATSAVMGDSLSAANGQIVFHIPVTANKSGVQHVGSNIVFFNSINNTQLVLRNPVIDLKRSQVTATIPQASNQSIAVLTITNAAEIKSKVTNDRKTGLRTNAFTGVSLSLAPGIATTIASILAMPEGSLQEAAVFGSADVSLYSKISK